MNPIQQLLQRLTGTKNPFTQTPMAQPFVRTANAAAPSPVPTTPAQPQKLLSAMQTGTPKPQEQTTPSPTTKARNWTQIRSAILKKYPSLTKTQLSSLDSAIKKRQVKENLELGIISPKDVATDYPDLASEAVRRGIPIEGKADETKTSSEKAEVVDTVSQLLQRDVEPVTGLLQFTSNIPGTDAALTKNLLNKLKGQLSLESREKLKGSGAISDFEFRVLGQAATELDRNLSAKDFYGVLQKLGESLGVEVAPTKKQKESTGSVGGELFDTFLGSAKRVAQDVGTGIAFNRENPLGATGDTLDQVQAMYLQADKTTDPARREQIYKEADGLLAQTNKDLENLKDMFSSEIDTPTWQRALETGIEVGTLAEAPSVIKGIVDFVKGGGKGLLRPNAIKTELDTVAKQSKTKINKKTLIDAVDSYVAKDPSARRFADVAKEGLNKNLSTTEVLERLPVWNKAYTAAGKTGKSAKAGVYDALSKAARSELAKDPQVFDLYRKWAQSLGIQAFTKKIPGRLLSQAGAAATGALAGNYLIKPFIQRQEE